VSLLDLLTAVLVIVGAAFYLAGTVGLLRFPDLYSRIHALTKADNLGLGFVVLGLLIQAGSVVIALKLLLIWLLALAAAATSGYLIASQALGSSSTERSDDA
jgi:multicomponent Na+:H+ antiporter subunit G